MLIAILLTISCASTPKAADNAKYDVCVYFSTDEMHCFPKNQPGKSEYKRKIVPGQDVVMSYRELAKLEYKFKLMRLEILEYCD